MVSSRSNNSPHYVRALTSGQYVCDSSCLQWKSSQICAHTVAVSESNGDLQSFLDWYIASKQQPNYTSLATHGLPAGRGRKGGVPKRQRSKAQPRTQVTVRRPATCFGRFDDVNYNRAPQVHLVSHSPYHKQPQSVILVFVLLACRSHLSRLMLDSLTCSHLSRLMLDPLACSHLSPDCCIL